MCECVGVWGCTVLHTIIHTNEANNSLQFYYVIYLCANDSLNTDLCSDYDKTTCTRVYTTVSLQVW